MVPVTSGVPQGSVLGLILFLICINALPDVFASEVYCLLRPSLTPPPGVVGWCEGAVYLTSLGRPTDIGLQLGKACYPCSG